jgi:hypothetical protein
MESISQRSDDEPDCLTADCHSLYTDQLSVKERLVLHCGLSLTKLHISAFVRVVEVLDDFAKRCYTFGLREIVVSLGTVKSVFCVQMGNTPDRQCWTLQNQ